MAGALALAIYCVVVCHLLVRAWLRAAGYAAVACRLAVVAFGLLTLAGGQT